MGRRDWLPARSELGPTTIGIVQSLLVMHWLPDINPYGYPVDVPQRVGQHAASRLN